MRRSALLALAFGCVPLFINAAPPQGPAGAVTVQTSPLGLPPMIYGRTYTTTLVLQNNYDTVEEVEIGLGNPQVDPWISYFSFPRAVTLQPKERVEVPITITTPPFLGAPEAGESFSGTLTVFYGGSDGDRVRPSQTHFFDLTGAIYRQPSEEGRAIDRALAAALFEKLGTVVPTIDKSTLVYDVFFNQSNVLPTLVTDEYLDANNRAASKTVALGLFATADATAADCDAFVARLDSLVTDSGDTRVKTATYLRTRAVDVDAAYQKFADATVREANAWSRAGDPNNPDAASWVAVAQEAGRERERYGAEYYGLLTEEPLLGLTTTDGNIHWAALVRVPASDELEAMSVNTTFFMAGMTQYSAKATEIRSYTELGDYWQFLEPQYAPVRLQITNAGRASGSELLPYLMAELDAVGQGVAATTKADRMELQTAISLVAAASSLTPVAPAVSVAASTVDVGINMVELSEVSGQLDTARELGPVIGFDAVAGLENRRADSRSGVFVSALFGLVDVTEGGYRVIRANNLFGTGTRAAVPLVARAVDGVGELVTDARGILNRVDTTALFAGQGRFTVGQIDPRFAPVITVRADDQVMHLSEPFIGPEGKTFVYSYTEVPGGKVHLQVVYRSSEHTTFRIVPNGSPEHISKGPSYWMDPNTGRPLRAGSDVSPSQEIPSATNEMAIDLTHGLQSPLSLWFSGRPATQVDAKFFFGPVVSRFEASPVAKFLDSETIIRPTPDGFMDFSRPPTLVSSAWDNSPLYGWHQKFHYRHADGTIDYLVIRDRAGDVFVPSAHAAEASTSHGIRTWAFDTGGQTATKYVHKLQGRNEGRGEVFSNDIPEQFRDEYRLDTLFRTDLAQRFEAILPPPGQFNPLTTGLQLPEFPLGDLLAGPSALRGSPGRYVAWNTRALGGVLGNEQAVGGTAAPATVNLPNIGPAPAISWITDRTPFPSVEVMIGKPVREVGDANPGNRVLLWPGPTLMPGGRPTDDHYALATDRATAWHGGAVFAWNPAFARSARVDPTIQRLGATTDGGAIVIPGSVGRGGRVFGSAPGVFLKPAFAPVQAAPPDVTMYVTSTGQSMGEAFAVTIVNHGRDAVTLRADDLVLEPLQQVTTQTIERELAGLRNVGRMSTTLRAYCLQYGVSPPSPGMVYRIASDAVRREAGQFGSIFAATRRMRDLGMLPVDGGDPSAYVDSIRQWSIWTRERGFDAVGFADAFVAFTRSSAEAAGRTWTAEFEAAARQIVAGRWRAVRWTLQQAARLEAAASQQPSTAR